MKAEKILKEIDDCILRCDANDLADMIEGLLKVVSQEDAVKELTARLHNNYSTYNAAGSAKLMEVIIRKQPKLAMLKFPENYLFRLAVSCGSMDLYECYIEEAIEPFLKGKSDDEIIDSYMELFMVAEKLTESFFPKYVRCVKGLDFNGAFAQSEENPNAVLINQEDYLMMDDVVEKFNAILGRRDILKDLNKRMGQE